MQQYTAFFFNHWMLCGGFLAVIFLWISFELKYKVSGIKFINSAQVINLYNHSHAKLIDLRNSESFSLGHITGASNYSLDSLKKHLNKFSKENPVILICKDGQTSQKAATQFIQQGFEKVYVLQEGITGWQNANLPLITK